MLRWKIARDARTTRVLLSAFVLAGAGANGAAGSQDPFRDSSTLAPSVSGGNTDFGTRVLSRALRPVFVRPHEEAAAATPSSPANLAPAQHGWRPRSADGAAPQPSGEQRSNDAAEESGPLLIGALPRRENSSSTPVAPAQPLSGPALSFEPQPQEAATPVEDSPAEDSCGEPTLAAEDAEPMPAAEPDDELAGLSGDELDDALELRQQQAAAQHDRDADSARPLAAAADEAPETPDEAEETTPIPVVNSTARKRLPPLSRSQQALRDKVRRVLKHYYDNPLHTGNRGPWEVMHQMLAFEVHSRIRQGGPNGQPITAVGWLCFNMPCRERELLYLNNEGELRVRVGPALQGHQGQLLALLAQARVKSTYPIRVEGKEFTIADLVESEKKTCYPKTELTFKLLGLQAYLDLDARWVNDQGMTWDFATLVREEMHQPVRTAACGGTHRLSGLTFAYKKSLKTGRPLTGEFAAAKKFVANYQNYAYRLQNPDGSFSTEWFRGPGSEADLDRRLKTTGHILEWLLYAAEDKHFTYPRTVKAVNYLSNIMWNNRTRDWEAGPLGHAIHALVLYDRLYLQQYDEVDQDAVAASPDNSRR